MRRAAAQRIFGPAFGVGAALTFCLFSCGDIVPSVEPSPFTWNACPAHPCSAYSQPGVLPQCNQGRCTVCEGASCIAQSPDLVFVVSMPTDSLFAPGSTYAIPLDQLFATPSTATCAPPTCTSLPNLGVVLGYYQVTEQEQQLLGWYLGNPQGDTVVPAHATYKLLWPPYPESNSCETLVQSTMLPVGAVTSQEQTLNNIPLGPSAGESVAFNAVMQPGCYELTLSPESPFDQAFPPQVFHVTTVSQLNQYNIYSLPLDFTTATSGDKQSTLPTFQVRRSAGINGWTAWLRDISTRSAVSGMRHLQGSTVASVVLGTSHVTAPTDALTGTEIVIAPPPGETALPTEHIPALGSFDAGDVCYPPLPNPVVVQVTVSDAMKSTPVEADVLFRATGIDTFGDAAQCSSSEVDDAGLGDGSTGELLSTISLNTSNFEFVGQRHTTLDSVTGASSVSIPLPPGEYSVVIRPLDSAHSVGMQVLSVGVITTDGGTLVAPVPVSPSVVVTGTVYVADTRLLNEASVVAIPLLCADGSNDVSCMPRASSTTTDEHGVYSLLLDSGTYAISVRPIDGTGLPWTTVSSVAIPTDVSRLPLSPITVFAPIHAKVELEDPRGDPITGAVVRVFTSPSSGTSSSATSIEMGHAMTDGHGNVDLVLSPTLP